MRPYLSELPRRLGYLLLAAGLVFSQHLAAWLVIDGWEPDLLPSSTQFWLTPLRTVMELPRLPALGAALAFAYSLAVAWALAALSFRRAKGLGEARTAAMLTVVPVLQLLAIPIVAFLPASTADQEETGPDSRSQTAGVVFGLLAGVAIVVLAVLVSAVTFGAYGWGLFVMTPLLVGVTTGYLVNRGADIGSGRTISLVSGAAGLGSLALVVLALEGMVCILLAAPLALPVTMAGGAIGRSVALSRLRRRNPLACVAVLPLIFMLEAVTPPEAVIVTSGHLDISAPPSAVWDAVISDEPIRGGPGLSALAGLAYPLGSELKGHGRDAERIGRFSTGTARERVTEWRPGRRLAFRVLNQPPAMEEMSPYRRVHAPHLIGYFETRETRFDLVPIKGGGTRLSIRAEHRLRIDPVPYWEPIAQLAIRDNVDRVLRDIAEKAERR